jgi:hypothetical protein
VHDLQIGEIAEISYLWQQEVLLQEGKEVSQGEELQQVPGAGYVNTKNTTCSSSGGRGNR